MRLMPEEVTRREDEAEEINDGLFCVAGQRYLIEMTHYYGERGELYRIDILRVKAPNDDTYTNPSFVNTRDMLADFEIEEFEGYDDKDEAHRRFAELIFSRNHF